MTRLRVESIEKRFGGLEVLRDVSLEAQAGAVTAIIGPNGAGKSTLANIVSGLLTPNGGRVFLDGRDVTRLPAYRRARLGIGRTFQNLQLFAGMTVRENVLLGGYRNRIGAGTVARSEAAAVADDAIALLGIGEIEDVGVDALGFGQAKLVEPARVLAMDPTVLVMDEPAAGLGGVGVRTLAEWIRGRASADVAVVLIEHNMRLVMEIADHIYVLDHGVMIAEGPPAEIRRDPKVLEAYLGHDGAEEVAP